MGANRPGQGRGMQPLVTELPQLEFWLWSQALKSGHGCLTTRIEATASAISRRPILLRPPSGQHPRRASLSATCSAVVGASSAVSSSWGFGAASNLSKHHWAQSTPRVLLALWSAAAAEGVRGLCRALLPSSGLSVCSTAWQAFSRNRTWIRAPPSPLQCVLGGSEKIPEGLEMESLPGELEGEVLPRLRLSLH